MRKLDLDALDAVQGGLNFRSLDAHVSSGGAPMPHGYGGQGAHMPGFEPFHAPGGPAFPNAGAFHPGQPAFPTAIPHATTPHAPAVPHAPAPAPHAPTGQQSNPFGQASSLLNQFSSLAKSLGGGGS